MSKLLKNPNFNNISDFWAIGETSKETAKCLGITEEEVRKVYNSIDQSLEKYFEQQSNTSMTLEDEKYFVLINK